MSGFTLSVIRGAGAGAGQARGDVVHVAADGHHARVGGVCERDADAAVRGGVLHEPVVRPDLDYITDRGVGRACRALHVEGHVAVAVGVVDRTIGGVAVAQPDAERGLHRLRACAAIDWLYPEAIFLVP